MKTLPSRLKIALLSAGISGLVLVAFGMASWVYISRQKLESVDTEIRSLGARHPGWFAGRSNYARLDEALGFVFGEAHQNQVILTVRSTNGAVLHTSAGWPKDLDPASIDCRLMDDPNPPSLPYGGGRGMGPGGGGRGLGPGGGGGQVAFTKIPRFMTVVVSNGEWRLGMLGTAEVVLVIGLNYSEARAELARIRNSFIAALPVALLLIGMGGWVVAGRALRPLQNIADVASQVTARGLDQRIPDAAASPEAARLIRVLNGMMDRLEASFRQATRFSADASHELKTPLAIMQGELENALQAAPPGSPQQQLFSNLIEETQRLKTIIRSLLLLAQADAGRLPLVVESVDLSALLGDLVEDVRALAVADSLTIEARIDSGLRVEADRLMLQMALFNLLSNAVKYNEPQGRVTVALQPAGERLAVTVCNTGPGIPPEDQPKVFDRFYRGGRNRSPDVDGVGLGLSLAREIIRAHEGELILKKSVPGCTCFELLCSPRC